MEMDANKPEPIYLSLASESEDPSVTELESVCLQCFEKGTTRLLLTMLEHFREVMVSSFFCPHCHHSNNSLMSTGAVQDKGRKYKLKVCSPKDLSRMVVRSDKAIMKIPEVDLVVPNRADSGEITTVEGMVRRVVDGLQQDQDSRRAESPELADQIQAFMATLTAMLQGLYPFTLELDDPTGNSYIDRRMFYGLVDPQLSYKDYTRSRELDELLGLLALEESDQSKETRLNEIKEDDEDSTPIPLEECADKQPGSNDASSSKDSTSCSPSRSPVNKPGEKKGSRLPNDSNKIDKDEVDTLDVRGEVLQFFSYPCDNCYRPSQVKMQVITVPHFKDIIIMATSCDHCGLRDNEVKSGSGIEPKGCRISLLLSDLQRDLRRDVVKSYTCTIDIPELELHVGIDVMAGKYTTVEGLLVKIKTDLAKDPSNSGDSVEKTTKDIFTKLFEDIDKVMQGTLPVTLIMDDPTGNSFLGCAEDDSPDTARTVTRYERTFEQKEELGLNDMVTEGYEQDS